MKIQKGTVHKITLSPEDLMKAIKIHIENYYNKEEVPDDILDEDITIKHKTDILPEDGVFNIIETVVEIKYFDSRLS